ncbi:MAG: hypothetical protein KGY46_10920, partial [Anaerolineales bacterium]|nr:hypothetical protein [Anaerolineales bacterium]
MQFTKRKLNEIFTLQSFSMKMVMALLLIPLLMTGCSAIGQELATPTAATRHPFSARSESEGGAVVFWSGYTDGYRAGEQTTFDLTIKNNTDQVWQGRYCLQLMARESATVLKTLAQKEINLEPGMGFSDEFTVQMPETLDPGAYGLSMAVRRPEGPMVDLIPIQVGGSNEVRKPTSQEDMNASLEACPPVEREGAAEQVEQAKSDLAQRLDVDASEIIIESLKATDFSDASLGVPESGKSYAQVVTPGYIIMLKVDGQTYRYHASEQRVVFVPEETSPTPSAASPEEVSTIDIPESGAVVTLPLHVLAHTKQNGQEVKLVLRWEDGTQLSKSLTTLEGPKGQGLIVDSLDWETESQPPQPETDQAILSVENSKGAVLDEQPLTVLHADNPQTRLIDLYWVVGETLETEQRRVLDTGGIEAAAVKEL